MQIAVLGVQEGSLLHITALAAFVKGQTRQTDAFMPLFLFKPRRPKTRELGNCRVEGGLPSSGGPGWLKASLFAPPSLGIRAFCQFGFASNHDKDSTSLLVVFIKENSISSNYWKWSSL